jgi:hypothetical protein
MAGKKTSNDGKVVVSFVEGDPWASAFQIHHDAFVQLHADSDGQLNYLDRQDYLLAMEREKEGLVKPFTPKT